MLDESKLRAFLSEIGKAAKGPGRIYLTGGSTALLLGVRAQTVDIDIKLDPEPKGIFEAIAQLKESLSINVELASPDLFIPAIPGWRERSQFIGRWGDVEAFHYDFYGQSLAKISRGHGTDLSDVTALIKLGKVDPTTLVFYFEQIKGDLIRYPAISAEDFERRVQEFVARLER